MFAVAASAFADAVATAILLSFDGGSFVVLRKNGRGSRSKKTVTPN